MIAQGWFWHTLVDLSSPSRSSLSSVASPSTTICCCSSLSPRSMPSTASPMIGRTAARTGAGSISRRHCSASRRSPNTTASSSASATPSGCSSRPKLRPLLLTPASLARCAARHRHPGAGLLLEPHRRHGELPLPSRATDPRQLGPVRASARCTDFLSVTLIAQCRPSLFLACSACPGSSRAA